MSLCIATSGTLFALSHNLSLLMYTPIFAVFFFLNFALNRNWKSLLSVSVGGTLVFLLTAFYILPALLQKNFVQTWQLTIGKFDVLRNFATIDSLFGISSWYSLTPFSLILFMSVLGAMIFKKKEINKSLYANLCLFITILIILLFLTTSSSKVIWETLPLMKFFQFPWRLLSPVTFVLCFLAGSITYLQVPSLKLFPWCVKSASSEFVLPAVVLMFFIANVVCFFMPTGKSFNYLNINDWDFTPANIREENLSDTISYEYRPIWVREKSESPFGKGLVCSYPGTEIKVIEKNTIMREYTVYLQEKCLMTANVHYFPGWKIYNNGIPVHFKTTKQGLMEFALPAGTHHLKVIFEDTPVRKAGNLLSVLGLFAYGALLFIDLKTRLRGKLRD